MNSIISKPSFCSLQNKIRTIEEVLSSWIMDFFDDPIYSDPSRQWNTTSLMMLRPQASVVIYLFYYHQWLVNHDLLIHNMHQFVIGLLVKTNQLLRTIFKCMYTLINKTIWFRKTVNKLLSNTENLNEKWNSNKFTYVSLTSLIINRSLNTNVSIISFPIIQSWVTCVNHMIFFNAKSLFIFRIVKKKLYWLIL